MIWILLLMTTLFSTDLCATSSSPKEYIRGCYFTNWSQYRPSIGKYLPEDYEIGLCTHIFYSYVDMDETFKIRSDEPNDEDTAQGQGLYSRVNALKQKQPGLKTLLSIGGYYFSRHRTSEIQEMINKADNRRIFIESAIAFVRRLNFDGLSIAWLNYFLDVTTEYSLLIRELRESIAREAEATGRSQLLLTADFPARIDKTLDQFDGEGTAERLDFIEVLASSFQRPGEGKIRFHSPLFDHDGDELSVSSAMLYWSRVHKIPREKLTVGLGTFGMMWSVPLSSIPPTVGTRAVGPNPSMSESRTYGMAAYYEICALLQYGKFTAHYDEVQRAAFLYNGSIWISYDNQRSFHEKLDWLIENGYGGAVARSLDLDDFKGLCDSSFGLKCPLISAMKAKLAGRQTGPTTSTDTISTTSAPSASTAEEAPFKCLAPGTYIDPDSCHSFYVCDVLNRVYYVSCPAGMYFSRVSFMCDLPYLAGCKRPNM